MFSEFFLKYTFSVPLPLRPLECSEPLWTLGRIISCFFASSQFFFPASLLLFHLLLFFFFSDRHLFLRHYTHVFHDPVSLEVLKRIDEFVPFCRAVPRLAISLLGYPS